MKPLLIFLFIGFSCLLRFSAHAQGPDHAQYNQDITRCDDKRQKLIGKLDAMQAEKETALRELRQGYFCSKCRNSKTSIEKGGENFEAHLGRVKGERVPATQAEIAENQNRFQDKIKSLYAEKDANEQECQRLTTTYLNARKDAEARSQQEALRKQQQQAEAQQQRAAEAQQQQLAAQREKEAELRRQQEMERRAREEAERVRQAQLAANILAYNNRINSNNADTQAKLEEQRRNGNLNGISTYSRESEQNARGTVNSTNSGALGRQAFGDDGFLGGGLYTNTKELTQEIIRQKLNEMADNARNYVKEQINNHLFGEDPNAQETDHDDNGGSPWSDLKSRIQTNLAHKIGNRLLEVDSRNGGVLNRLYAPYARLKQEQSHYDERTLNKFNEENMEYISKGFDAIANDDDPEKFQQVSDDFFRNTPKRFTGVMRKWLTRGKRVYMDELLD